MSGFSSEREFVYTNGAALNNISTEYNMAMQRGHQSGHVRPGYDFQSDLDMFTNTQFFDLDMGEVPETDSPASHDGEHWTLPGNYLGDTQISTFNSFAPGSSNGTAFNAHPDASSATTPSMIEQMKTMDGEGKSVVGISVTMEEASRMAAEEDKRRRNTAASARFRVKKKQREQALEKTAKDMTDRVTFLENRVTTLEMENKLLKDLITEKSGAGATVDLDVLRRKAESQQAIEKTDSRIPTGESIPQSRR